MRKKSIFIAAVLCFMLMAVPVMVQASEEEATSLVEQAVALMEAGEYEDALVPLLEAVEMGDVSAQNLLGNFYRNGYGVEQDVEEAARYYQLSADQGNIPAKYNAPIKPFSNSHTPATNAVCFHD